MSLQVDSPYCWLQAISAFLFHAVFFGLVFSFGIFYVALLQEFPGKESEAAWITGINFSCIMLVSPLSIWLLSFIPPRIVSCTGTLLASLGLYLSSKASSIWFLYMTFGVMYGMGGNLCYISAIWIIRKNFQKYKDTAMGLASAGSGAGGILFGILLPFLVESRGWRGAMELVSYITLALVIVSMVMIPAQQESEKSGKTGKRKLLSWKPNLKAVRSSIPSPWRNRAFVVLSITILLCAFVSSIPYCHIVNYAIHQGVSRSESERLPLFISTGSFIGRVMVGRLAGFQKVSRITLYQITFLVQCLATILCILTTNTACMVLYSLVFGVFDGAFACLLGIVVDDVFVDKNQAMKAIGQLFQLLAFPYAFGAPFAGWLYTQTGSYRVAFLTCGAILFTAACLVSLVRYLLQSGLSIPVLSLPERIDVSPVYESSGDLEPVLRRNSNRLMSSRACSFLDLAVEVYSESYNRSSAHLAVYQDNFPRSLNTENRKNSEVCSQNLLEAGDRTFVENKYEFTDITIQISGVIETGNVGLKTGNASCLTNQHEQFSRQKNGDDVIVSISTNLNEEFCRQGNNDVVVLDSDVSDTSSLDCGDNYVSKRCSSGISIDDAGYFSSAAPANYVDSDTQSATSRCDVRMSMVSKEGSLDSVIEKERNENCKGFCADAEGLGNIGRVYQ